MNKQVLRILEILFITRCRALRLWRHHLGVATHGLAKGETNAKGISLLWHLDDWLPLVKSNDVNKHTSSLPHTSQNLGEMRPHPYMMCQVSEGRL